MEIKDLVVGMKLKDVGTGDIYKLANIYSGRVVLATEDKKCEFFTIDYILKYFVEVKEDMQEGDYVYYITDNSYRVCKIRKIDGDKIRGYYKDFLELPESEEEFNQTETNKCEGWMHNTDLIPLTLEKVEDSKSKTLELKYNSIVKIINGTFKGIEGKLIAVFSNTNYATVSIDGDIENSIDVHLSDIEVVEEIKPEIIKPKNETFEDVLTFLGTKYFCKIKIRGFRTSVKLLVFGISGSVFCNEDDMSCYDKQNGIDRAFKKAIIKELLSEVNA